MIEWVLILQMTYSSQQIKMQDKASCVKALNTQVSAEWLKFCVSTAGDVEKQKDE